MNKVVARFLDGRMIKGTTIDFFPNKQIFHIAMAAGAQPVEIDTQDLKAIFFVKDLEGDAERVDRQGFDEADPAPGRKIHVEFEDGEVLVGTTTGYHPGRPGFFLVPADRGSNIDRLYVVSAATRAVRFL